MMTLTCPDHSCGYNGFGVCQMDIPAEALRMGRVTQHSCPYYRAAQLFLQSGLPGATIGTEGLPGNGLAQPGQWFPKTAL